MVKNARACTLCRECIREAEEGEEGGEGEKWTDRVSLRRVKDHFICKYYVDIKFIVLELLNFLNIEEF